MAQEFFAIAAHCDRPIFAAADGVPFEIQAADLVGCSEVYHHWEKWP